jgi:hypothetical protein
MVCSPHRIQASASSVRRTQTRSVPPLFVHAVQLRPRRNTKPFSHWLYLCREKLIKLCPIFDVSMAAKVRAPGATRSAARRHAGPLTPRQRPVPFHMREDSDIYISA